MKIYIVRFFYHTDLRCDWTGEAKCEITALALAMIHHKLTEGWSNAKGFRVEIHTA